MRLVTVFIAVLFCAGTANADDSEAKKQARAHFIAGTAFYEAGTYDRAITEYKEAYKILPLPGLLFNLGQAYRLHGDLPDAKSSYQKYLAAEPIGPIADDARAHLQELQVARPSSRARPPVEAQARERFQKGTVYYGSGAYDRAIWEYEAAYKLFPLPGMQFNLGQAYRLHGDFALARDAYRRYLDTDPTGAIADQARVQLQAMLAVAPITVPVQSPRRALVATVDVPSEPHRRRWIIPVAVVGGALVIGAVVVGITLGTASTRYPSASLGSTTPLP